MARYIDADELFNVIGRAANSILCEPYKEGEARGLLMAMKTIKKFPTADVAPRAEVDEAYWEGVEYGHKDGAALVAREIFEELDEIMLPFLHEVSQVYIYVKLKRKYTEAET